MNIVIQSLKDFKHTVMHLGFTGENDHTTFHIISDEVFNEYPDAEPELMVESPAGFRYRANVTRENNEVLWTITETDLQYVGVGAAQLSFTVLREPTRAAVIPNLTRETVRTYIAKTKIHESIILPNSQTSDR